MPVISATEFTTLPAVRVIVNWADVPAATHVTVFRVDCETGERTQLRPYVAFNRDGYLLLSCGMAIFWDTEVPLDRCFRYCTQAENVLGTTVTTASNPIFMDSFTRTVVDSWGTADTGQTYTTTGPAANFDVNAGRGAMTVTATPQTLLATVNTVSVSNGVFSGRYQHPVTPTGADHTATIPFRYVNTTNFCDFRLFLHTDGTVSGAIRQVVAGVEQNLILTAGNIPGITTITDIAWEITFQGNVTRVKVWPASLVAPTTYVIDNNTMTWLTTGTVGAQVLIPVGSTNVTPYTGRWDDLLLVDPCPNLITVEQCSQDLMISSSGFNMLRDPVRPCNDLHVGLCWTPNPDCIPGRGVFFARLDGEGYGANSIELQAFNAARPASASRERSDAQSTLTLVTRSFADRDAVLQILRAGTPLLWQSPPEYGSPDRYISVKDVGVSRYRDDHRYEPRAITMPFVVEDRPEGPTEGICGARVRDLCDTFTSWDAMEVAGLSYLDLLEGNASGAGPVDANRRRWIDVETGFANWLGVETAPNTWKSLRDGE